MEITVSVPVKATIELQEGQDIEQVKQEVRNALKSIIDNELGNNLLVESLPYINISNDHTV